MRSTRPGRWLAPIAALLGGLALASAALAQEAASDAQLGAPVATGSGPLETTVSAESLRQEEGADGKVVRTWEPASRLRAGDEVYYTIRVRNPGKAAVTDIVVTKRLPFGMHYLRGSATGPACEVHFSIDGGTHFARAERLGAAADGRPARKVGVAEYTHVRWVLSRPLAPGATALLRFRAIFT